MDLFEKINRSFGSWYEGLFGGGDDVRPKDILRRILAAMEDHRKEGFDNRIYVPNQYILEVNVDDEEEKEYLLAFLDRDELEAAIRRYCQQNHYHIRGALDFTIKETEEAERAPGKRSDKVRVRCRYNTRVADPEPAARALTPADLPPEERTVAAIFTQSDGEEGGTVPAVTSAALVVYAPHRAPFRYPLARGVVSVGRSARAGNDLVIDTDGQVSRRHIRIEREADRCFTIYDLGSVNGTKVNGRRVENHALSHGDEIHIGQTRLAFEQSQGEAEQDALAPEEPRPAATQPSPSASGRFQGAFGGAAAAMNHVGAAPRRATSRAARLVLTDRGEEVEDFLLASETMIGRAVTNDIVLPDRSIATRHARIFRGADGYALENLDAAQSATTLNGAPLPPGRPTLLTEGDILGIGALTLRFEGA